MAESQPAQRVQLSDVSGLFAALRNPSIKLRSAVLRAIAANPAPALALGKLHDWDGIDELIHQICQQGWLPYHRLLVRALADYRDDPRAEKMLHKVAVVTRDEEIRRLARAGSE